MSLRKLSEVISKLESKNQEENSKLGTIMHKLGCHYNKNDCGVFDSEINKLNKLASVIESSMNERDSIITMLKAVDEL